MFAKFGQRILRQNWLHWSSVLRPKLRCRVSTVSFSAMDDWQAVVSGLDWLTQSVTNFSVSSLISSGEGGFF